LQGGAGGEFLLRSGIALGGELNYTAPTSGRIGGFGAAAINGSYHFGGRDLTRKLVPFLTGGGFLTFSGANGGANLGGGAQYWWSERTALRLEFRTHIVSSDAPYIHVFRFGLAFR
jgi:hypothetical protein